MAKRLVKLLSKNVKIIPVTSDVFSDKFFAPRPRNEVIRSVKIVFPCSWKESLDDYITNEMTDE